MTPVSCSNTTTKWNSVINHFRRAIANWKHPCLLWCNNMESVVEKLPVCRTIYIGHVTSLIAPPTWTEVVVWRTVSTYSFLIWHSLLDSCRVHGSICISNSHSVALRLHDHFNVRICVYYIFCRVHWSFLLHCVVEDFMVGSPNHESRCIVVRNSNISHSSFIVGSSSHETGTGYISSSNYTVYRMNGIQPYNVSYIHTYLPPSNTCNWTFSISSPICLDVHHENNCYISHILIWRHGSYGNNETRWLPFLSATWSSIYVSFSLHQLDTRLYHANEAFRERELSEIMVNRLGVIVKSTH